MADLFDMRIGGAGWHLTSHLIAIAALFVACFAITGYITFRDDSVPGAALKDQDADLEDIIADSLKLSKTLEVTGAVTMAGNATVDGVSFVNLGELVSIPHSTAGGMASAAPKTIVGTIDAQDVTGYNMQQCEKLFNFLSTKDSLTAAEITTLFGTTATTASSTSTIAAMVAADVPNNGMDATLGVQFLTGGWGGSAQDIGALNPFADMADDAQNLVVFGGNTSTGTGALTLTPTTDFVDASGGSIAFSGVDNDVFTVTASSSDAATDIVLTPANGTIIKKGSFIYRENISADVYILRGYLKIGGVALTSASS